MRARRARRILIGVTGSAGAGKSRFARSLAHAIGGARIIEINDVVNKAKAYDRIERDGTKVVDIARLSDALLRALSDADSEMVIVVGHLLPEIPGLRPDAVFVVRAGLKSLERRLIARGYGRYKIKENILAEALDYCGLNSRAKGGRVFEVETGADKRKAISAVKRWRFAGLRRGINEMGQLEALIMDGNRYGF
ncbi:MAG: AAA family ATPase [Candidatus Micrarchaeota archaeon]|nr:AAA family ATPase [Candidatus Micrarchaeota archaeon]